MAAPTLITKLSRRTILAGGGAGISATAIVGIAAPPVPDGPPGPDAELLRRIAVVARRWAECQAADTECQRLLRVLRLHPDYPGETLFTESASRAREALAVKTGYRAADEFWERTWERHDAAVRAAFAVPARTLPGLRLKLKTALKAAKGRDFGTFEESDYRWLDNAMADLERFAG